MSNVTIETNPYQIPAAPEGGPLRNGTPDFSWPMSVTEFHEVHRAKQRLTSLAGKLIAFVFLAIGIAASTFGDWNPTSYMWNPRCMNFLSRCTYGK